MRMPAHPAPAWTDHVLDPMRQVTDPLADAVVAEAFQQGQADAVNTLMRTLIENDDLPSDHLPQGMRAYLATSAQMPAWVDPARLQAGERVFWRYGPEIIMNLFCYGLPSCYAGAKGVQVLVLTTRLFSNPTRRVIETAQMVVDVMAPGGLAAQDGGAVPPKSPAHARRGPVSDRHPRPVESGLGSAHQPGRSGRDAAGVFLGVLGRAAADGIPAQRRRSRKLSA